MEKELMVLDGHSLLNRAFYGLKPLTTREGLPTGAVYGFLSILGALLQNYNPDALCVCFDVHAPTFRTELFDGYKAQRKAPPEEFTAQIPIMKEVLGALRIPIFEMSGYEADDLLGTISKRCADAGWSCAVVTGDRDSYQLIGPGIRVLYVGTKETKPVTEETLKEIYGLTPKQMIDLKAMMGDASDNIPGLPGVGEKTALKLMRDYGSLDNLYAHTDELSGKLKERVEQNKELAYLSQTLVTIKRDIPIGFTPEDCRRTAPDAAALRTLFQKLEFQNALKRWLPDKPAAANEVRDGENLSFFDEPAEEPLPDGVFRNIKAVWKSDFDAGRPLTPCKGDLALGAFLLQKPELSWEDTERELHELGMWDLYEKIEMPLSEVLASMEHLGIKIDKKKLIEYGQMLDENARELEDKIYRLAGTTFNIGSPKQLGELLFGKLKLPGGKKNKTGWVTDADTLNKLKNMHPMIPAVLEYRGISKLKSTYADGLLKVTDESGHIHSTFQMTVVATGRLSSTDPNLQNIPVRTELGGRLRGMFIPSRPDWVLVDADYSQIELRVLAHIARDQTMIEAFESGEDIHAVTASQVFGVPLEQVTPVLRRNAKAVNFGIVYGISPFSLSEDIGVTVSEAKDYIEGYLEKYHGVREYMKSIVETARTQGYVTTLFNRRRYLPELSSKNFNIRSFGERAALNTPIQGTAADIIKKAMVNVYARLKAEKLQARLILQVHDELIVECPETEAETVKALLRTEMEAAFPLRPALVAEAHAGKNWLDAK